MMSPTSATNGANSSSSPASSSAVTPTYPPPPPYWYYPGYYDYSSYYSQQQQQTDPQASQAEGIAEGARTPITPTTPARGYGANVAASSFPHMPHYYLPLPESHAASPRGRKPTANSRTAAPPTPAPLTLAETDNKEDAIKYMEEASEESENENAAESANPHDPAYQSKKAPRRTEPITPEEIAVMQQAFQRRQQAVSHSEARGSKPRLPPPPRTSTESSRPKVSLGKDEKNHAIVKEGENTWYMGCVPLGKADEEGKHWLNELHIFLRSKVCEVFSATQDDVSFPLAGRNRPISIGQVGIRCMYCKGT